MAVSKLVGAIALLGLAFFVFRPAPNLGKADPSIREQIKNLSASERVSRKGDAVVTKARWVTYVSGEYSIEIRKVEKIEGGVQVFARAWKNGNPVGFGSDGTVEIERFQIFNPPVMVPDGTCTEEIITLGSRQETTCTPNYREDPEEALRRELAHTIKLVGKEGNKIVAGKVGNTTSTFYPDANPETSSVDGYVGRDAGAEGWATVRGGAGTNADDTGIGYVATQDSGGTTASLFRGILVFNTAAIPDTDTISSATLSLYGRAGSDQSCTSNAQTGLNFTSSSPASNTALAATDYPVANFGSTAFLDTAFTFASFSTGAYNDGVLNASGIANISVTGVSKFAARLGGDISNTEPTCSGAQAAEYRSESADFAGTTSDPKLVVVHAVAATSDFGTVILFE